MIQQSRENRLHSPLKKHKEASVPKRRHQPITGSIGISFLVFLFLILRTTFYVLHIHFLKNNSILSLRWRSTSSTSSWTILCSRRWWWSLIILTSVFDRTLVKVSYFTHAGHLFTSTSKCSIPSCRRSNWHLIFRLTSPPALLTFSRHSNYTLLMISYILQPHEIYSIPTRVFI